MPKAANTDPPALGSRPPHNLADGLDGTYDEGMACSEADILAPVAECILTNDLLNLGVAEFSEGPRRKANNRVKHCIRVFDRLGHGDLDVSVNLGGKWDDLELFARKRDLKTLVQRFHVLNDGFNLRAVVIDFRRFDSVENFDERTITSVVLV